MMYFRNLMGGKFEIPENAIQYVPSSGGKLSLSDPNIIKHQYNSGIGYVTYNSDVLSSDLFRYKSILSITLPPTITTLDEEAFYGCNRLTTLTLPNTITESRWGAFDRCSSLQHVHIPDLSSWLKINYINNLAHPFYAVTSGDLYINGEKLTDITIPEDITTIPFSAFRNCKSLTNITIPNHVTAIERSAFDGCDLDEITFGRNVTSIGYHIYNSCKKINIPNLEWLFNIEYADQHGLYDNGGIIYIDNQQINDIVIPESVTKINDYIFINNDHITSINIPPSITEICNGAFRNVKSLESVYITDLEAWLRITFNNSTANPVYNSQATLYLNGQELTDLVIPESITELKQYAFYNHKALTSITIPNSGIHVAHGALYGTSINAIHIKDLHAWCNTTFYSSDSIPTRNNIYLNGEHITTFIVPDDVEQINAYLFDKWDNEVILGKSVKSIKESAFQQSAITSIILPEGLETIWDNAFAYCSNLKSISIPTTLTSIGNYSFYGCTSLAQIVIPDNVITLGDYVFSYCENLEYVKIGNGVETIPDSAFSRCTSLKTVVLGSSVKNIEISAMNGCTSLESVYIKSNTVVGLNQNSIPSNNANLKIYVPFDLVEAYNNNYLWNSYNIIGFDFENNDI